jgi:hypothetical protein
VQRLCRHAHAAECVSQKQGDHSLGKQGGHLGVDIIHAHAPDMPDGRELARSVESSISSSLAAIKLRFSGEVGSCRCYHLLAFKHSNEW